MPRKQATTTPNNTETPHSTAGSLQVNHNPLEVNKEALTLINKGFKEAGIDISDPYRTLKDGLSATRAIVSKFGDISYEDDFSVRHKYMVTALELMQHLKNKTEDVKQVSVSIGIRPGDIDRLEAITKELDALNKRLGTERWQQGLITDAQTTPVQTASVGTA